MLILRVQLLATQRQLYVATRRNGNKSWWFHFMFVIYLHSKLQVTIPITCMNAGSLNFQSTLSSSSSVGATARGGPWPPLQYASRSLGPLLCLSIRLYPSFSGPWTRHPAISFLVFLFVLLHTTFRTASFFGGVLHSFYIPKPSYSLAFNKPDNVLSLDYGF